GLEEKDIMLKSQAVLAAHPNLNAEQRALLDKLLFRIKSVLTARGNRYLLMNVPNDRIDAIIEILPGMKAPTVMQLATSGWSSIHTVINDDQFWDIIDRLREQGAEGILIIPIEKMII
ncbi:MAG: ATP phosphoribosyltransferase, partial [Bacteroidota bacterium]